jgi:hypothetical protein
MRHADYDREAVIEWIIRHQLSRRNQIAVD